MTARSEWIVLRDAARVRLSGGEVILEDHYIPQTIEISVNGKANDGPDPETYARIDVDQTGRPRLTELRFVSEDPGGPGIRQGDLRDVQVSALIGDLVAMFTIRIDRGASAEDDRAITALDDLPGLTRFVDRMRAGKATREITPDLLERVAKVYRENFERAPTKAVERQFQVSQRMAAEYVSRARKRGLLPPTKQGKKNI